MTQSKVSYNNSITGASCLLGCSPEAITAFLESKEREYIQSLETEKKHLTNTVQRLMKDRQRIMDGVKQLFSEVKE
jgi:epoxyqueuosine reductase QueG